MATYQDIADYYKIDQINERAGNNVTRSLAALALYRFIKGLSRHMGWPEAGDDNYAFGPFAGSPDSASATVTFTAVGRSFHVHFELQYNGPKVESAITCPPNDLVWQLTIEGSQSLRYAPRTPDSVSGLNEQAAEIVLLKSRNWSLARPLPEPLS